jgi:hypothetical protein
MEKMKFSILFVIVTSIVTLTIVGCRRGTASQDSITKAKYASPRKTMRAFGSEQELTSYFQKLDEDRKLELERRRELGEGKYPSPPMADAGVTVPAIPAQAANTEAQDSVTNIQHAGVDEGDIVKLHGNHLVVLRRGRLFTVSVADGSLKPISVIDAFASDIDPRNTWYDEMLISGNTIVVIGYSYERGGTEIGLFDIDQTGNLRYRETYHLRSNDYYSSRNYASRLIGNKLIFYTPLYLSTGSEDPFKSFPALRKWHKGAQDSEFERIVSATRVYRPEQQLSSLYGMALHTVTICDLAGLEMKCEATAVLGPPGRVFYVSPNSVYVWVTDEALTREDAPPNSMLYRMPLDGSAPGALGVSGSPVDQFSFLESQDNNINVLVRSEAKGDGMWAAEVAAGDVALMRVPLESFSDGSDSSLPSNYSPLPKPEGYTFQNRFVGEFLLYGTGSGWGSPQKGKRSSLYVARWAGGGAADLALPHGVDRIEVMGSGAVIVGTDGEDLHFTSISLSDQPAVVHSYTRKGSSQGELRSHGFFYKAEGSDSGLLGLPIRGGGRPGYEHLFEGSASVLFLRNENMQLNEIGDLASKAEGSSNDGCRASCVDWYGNTRPLFLQGRIFALLGYEIVEGTITGGRIRETRRVGFAPYSRKEDN